MEGANHVTVWEGRRVSRAEKQVRRPCDGKVLTAEEEAGVQ